jgi:hypothetical protein
MTFGHFHNLQKKIFEKMLVANYESWTKILIFVALRLISRHAA